MDKGLIKLRHPANATGSTGPLNPHSFEAQRPSVPLAGSSIPEQSGQGCSKGIALIANLQSG
jgi:hypothetical protein